MCGKGNTPKEKRADRMQPEEKTSLRKFLGGYTRGERSPATARTAPLFKVGTGLEKWKIW